MKTTKILLAMLAIALVFGMTACDTATSSGGDPTSIVYNGYQGSDTYRLTISKNPSRAAYTPENGDRYTLDIVNSVFSKTSKGTVQAISSGIEFTLKPEYDGSTTFKVEISSAGITNIKGEIALENGGSLPEPGAINPGQASGGGDTWTNVKSLTQLNGTWKGTGTGTTATGWPGIICKVVQEDTITIISANNANAGTMSGSTKGTATFSGSNINAKWTEIKAGTTVSDPSVTLTFNDETHTVTVSGPINSRSISLSVIPGAQINQNGTKFKLPESNTDGDYRPAMVYTKQ